MERKESINMKKILPLLLILTGCASLANLEAKLNQYLNQPKELVLNDYGIPDNSYVSGDSEYISYSSHRSMYLPANYTTNFYGNYATTSSYGGNYVNFNCQITFTIDTQSNLVTNWRYQGNDCAI